jgi:hypothetical protein
MKHTTGMETESDQEVGDNVSSYTFNSNHHRTAQGQCLYNRDFPTISTMQHTLLKD